MSDAEIQKQLENLQKSGQLPASSDDQPSQPKSDLLPESTVDSPDDAKEEFDELSQLDKFEETEKEEVPIVSGTPSAGGVLTPFGYEIFNLHQEHLNHLRVVPLIRTTRLVLEMK